MSTPRARKTLSAPHKSHRNRVVFCRVWSRAFLSSIVARRLDSRLQVESREAKTRDAAAVRISPQISPQPDVFIEINGRKDICSETAQAGLLPP